MNDLDRYSLYCLDIVKNLSAIKKFKFLLKESLITLRKNGFGNTIAFLLTDNRRESLLLLFIVANYLSHRFNIFRNLFNRKITKDIYIKKTEIQNYLFKNFILTETDKYILATEETLKLLENLIKVLEDRDV